MPNGFGVAIVVPGMLAEMPDDEAASTMASTIIHLASSLGIDHLAEGIEREDQLAALRELGCGMGQGYLLGRPVELAARAVPRAAAFSA